MTPVSGNTHEMVLNAALAQLLRSRGLEAEAEQSVRSESRRHRVDVLVELGEFAVAIEAEFAPGRTVRGDAESRLTEHPLMWRGLSVEFVFALLYPDRLRAVPESQARKELVATESLRFAIVSRRESGGAPSDKEAFSVGTWHQGSVAVLAEHLHDFWIRSLKGGSVQETVDLASLAIEQAGDVLRRWPGRHVLAAAGSDPESTSALIWLNALLFQELLASHLDPRQLPADLRSTGFPRADPECRPWILLRQWKTILRVNWWPIFHVAREALKPVPTRQATLALQCLARAVRKIAGRGVIRHHDIAGRIFHRLLTSRKFLATNYTTIPAAVLLAGLAFDRESKAWKGVDWSSRDALRKLRIVDPACGSGTLLMAALQEILKLYRRSGGDANGQGDAVRAVLEEAIHGYDVVPAAIHLTAATLAMAEMRQIVANMPLYWMPHDVRNGKARLGSLDFLQSSPGKGQAQYLAMFPDESRDPGRVTGAGERVFDAYMPADCDLVIANPPYTRAGGPGTQENSEWNPIFGSVLSSADARLMQSVLRRTLDATPASLYAGLGSAFTVLAKERVKVGGRMAIVLPATALTGSRWAPVRRMLLDDFRVEWVVVSHDARNRTKRGTLPGRRFVAFSESTRIAEALIVATRIVRGQTPTKSCTRFVNLRRNPDEAIDAMAISRSLLATASDSSEPRRSEIVVGDVFWGEVVREEQAILDDGPWIQATFCQGRLADIAATLAREGTLRLGNQSLPIPIANLSESCEFGPYEMQIKNPSQGLFRIVETSDPTRAGHPAFWHHKWTAVTTMGVVANARLTERPDKSADAQAEMLQRAGRLQLARELGHAPQRVAAALADEAMLGVRSWITLLPRQLEPGKEEALCLWLNSTPGLLLRILCANRPYLGRSAVPHEVARTLPVLDIDALSKDQLEAADQVFRSLGQQRLRGFAHLADDKVRRSIDHRLFRDVLGYDVGTELDGLARSLSLEPTITTRH